MKIIFRQHIFLHHLLYPSNITSCKKLLFLGWTQPPCGYLTAFDRSQSSEPGYSTDGRALCAWSWVTRRRKQSLRLLGSHVLVPFSDSTWTGLASVPSADGPTSKSKAVDLESSFPCLRRLSEDEGPCAWGTPVRKGGSCFFKCWVVFRAVKGWIFYFIFFGKTSGFEREKLILKGFLKSYRVSLFFRQYILLFLRLNGEVYASRIKH